MVSDTTIMRCFMLCVMTIFAGMVVSSCATSKYYTEEDLGLRKEPLYDESLAAPVAGEPIKKEPGESSTFERSFENSPPLISHDITGMLPILQNDNLCTGCHMPDAAPGSGATPIPKSHFVDLETGKDLGETLDGKRYNCMQCHVIQTTISPPIENLFRGEFRDEESRRSSNLIKILNEGVETE